MRLKNTRAAEVRCSHLQVEFWLLKMGSKLTPMIPYTRPVLDEPGGFLAMNARTRRPVHRDRFCMLDEVPVNAPFLSNTRAN